MMRTLTSKMTLIASVFLSLILLTSCGGGSSNASSAEQDSSSNIESSQKDNSSDSSSKKSSSKSSKSSSSKSSKKKSSSSIPKGAIKWNQAYKHVGEKVAIYGKVMGATYSSYSNGSPTFINIGANYPDPDRVTAIIWEEDRSAFSGSPESMYRGKTICVTGEVYIYSGACNIKVTSPSQIKVIK